MTAHLVDSGSGSPVAAGQREVEERLREKRFFWLDLEAPTEAELGFLGDAFGFHPLALDASRQFGQRAKAEPYGEYVFLVVYGAAPPPDHDRLVEVHCFFSERYLVTIRRDPAPACDILRDRHAARPAPVAPIRVLYELIDELVDSLFTALDEVDDRIDALEEAIFAGPGEEELQQIFDTRRQLVTLRHAVTPERDLVAGIVNGAVELPGVSAESRLYFRAAYDHLLRVSEQIDNYRDVLASAMDVYLSTVSNRLNAVMKQLTVIATIFLPLAFITGFFGQNFAFMERHIAGWPAFAGLGIGLELVATFALLVYFRRRGWF